MAVTADGAGGVSPSRTGVSKAGVRAGAGIVPGLKYDAIKLSLLSPDPSVALAAAQSVRDRIEIVHTAEFADLLRLLLPSFSSVLTAQTRPTPNTKSVEYRLRHTVLDILAKFPHDDILRPHAPSLLSLAMEILARDYEENSLLAGRMVFDLHKSYRPALGDGVQPFLDFVMGCYRGMGGSVIQNFGGCRVERYVAAAAAKGVGLAEAVVTTPTKGLPSAGLVGRVARTGSPKGTGANLVAAADPKTPDSLVPGTPKQPASVGSESGPSSSHHAAEPSTQTAAALFNPPSFRSTSSFKVLTECPLTVMLLFQLYPKYMKSNITILIPLMMECLGVRGPPSGEYEYKAPLKKEDKGAAAAGDANSSFPASAASAQPNKAKSPSLPSPPAVSPQVIANLQSLALRHHTRLTRDLIAAQVKTLSFLTYLLRGYANDMAPYTDRIAASVVHLMQSCPRDALSTRKELLVATRHILATDFRSGFYRRIDSLLDDRVLVGSARPASNELLALRPLGYSTLADLVHHVRAKLSMAQVNRVVSVFGRVIHDGGGGLVLPDRKPKGQSQTRPSSLPQPSNDVVMEEADADGSGSDHATAVLGFQMGSAYPSPHPPIATTVLPSTPTPPLPLPVRITSVRLLLNLVDHVYHNRERDAQLGRDVLYRILDILVRKLESVKEWGAGAMFILEDIDVDDDEEECAKEERVRVKRNGTGGKTDVVPMELDVTPTRSNRDGPSSADEKPIPMKAVEGGGSQAGPSSEQKEKGESSTSSTRGEVETKKGATAAAEREHHSRKRKHSYLRSLVPNPNNSSYGTNEKGNSPFDYPPPTQEQIQSIQALIRPIIMGLKTVIWCINNYGSQRERARKELGLKAAAAAAASASKGSDRRGKEDGGSKSKKKKKSKDKGKDSKSSQQAASDLIASTMGREDSPLAIQKLTNAERELIDRYIIAALACIEVFRVDLSNTPVNSDKTCPSDDESPLIDFGRWPSRSEVLGEQGYNVGHLSNIERVSDNPAHLVLPLLSNVKSQVHSRQSHSYAVAGKACKAYQSVVGIFAATYSVLDPYNLRRILGPRLDLLFNAMVADPINFQVLFAHLLLGVPNHTAGASASFDFCDILLEYLTKRIDDLRGEKVVATIGTAHHPSSLSDPSFYFEDSRDEACREKLLRRRRAACLLRLFDLCLSSMNTFAKNEETIRPRLQTLVATCLRRTMEDNALQLHSPSSWIAGNEKQSIFPGSNFLHLLRSIFRSVSGGKFEESYKEIFPLLPTILNGLWRVYCSISPPPNSSLSFMSKNARGFTSTSISGKSGRSDLDDLRDVIIDLSLTIPARLSSLLPHLPLLVRVIIPALQSESGDLVNLGLRTLEFWIDNLNPTYLYPILSTQTEVLVELMTALTQHLRPAPYPYGLLTLRLMGKLGGKNRLWLKETMNITDNPNSDHGGRLLSIECEWDESSSLAVQSEDEKAKDDESGSKMDEGRNESAGTKFALPLPLDRAVAILRSVACSPTFYISPSSSSQAPKHGVVRKRGFSEDISFMKPEGFLSETFMKDSSVLDLNRYCVDVLETTKSDQAVAALTIIKNGLAMALELPTVDAKEGDFAFHIPAGREKFNETNDVKASSEQGCKKSQETESLAFAQLIRGLFYATQVCALRKEASALLIGLATHMLLVCESYNDFIVPIDSAGHQVEPKTFFSRDGNVAKPKVPLPAVISKIQPLPPFGNFRFEGPLAGKVNPFVINEVVVEMLCEGGEVEAMATKIIEKWISLSKTLVEGRGPSLSCVALFESLLSHLLNTLLSTNWPRRSGLYHGITCLLQLGAGSAKDDDSVWLGSSTSRFPICCEVEIVHAALFSIKDCPRESAIAAKEAIEFYFEIWNILYGSPDRGTGDITEDCLAVDSCEWSLERPIVNTTAPKIPNIEPDENEETKSMGLDNSATVPDDKSSDQSHKRPSATVLHLLLTELCSTKQLLRFAVRHSLRYLLPSATSESSSSLLCDLFKTHLTQVKRSLFSRSLRILPLPDQVGVVEGLTFLVSCAKDIFPISDQNLLASVSELLKMLSLADGALTGDGGSSIGVAIDKNGHVFNPSIPKTDAPNDVDQSPRTHASAIFLRSEITVCTTSYRAVIPAELSMGVQLRIASLALFRALVKNHTDAFFDAANNTPVGNVRPHVISLFFRSLVSNPPEAVAAAYAALRDVLTLSAQSPKMLSQPEKETAEIEGKRSASSAHPVTHRLPKELLQTCIRPVLLNLRNYTKLNPQLLRGISRLLSLLSSWFNQTLGEKLLDHLQKFTDPDKILSEQIYREGEEPLIAAAIIDLFTLLPHSAHFVEPLVKTTIRLESVLPRYKYTNSSSPYRAPLAKYLDKNYHNTVSFFVTQNRMKNPLYSDLFQEILQRKECLELRQHLGGKECSVKLINVCFERPLAIIRASAESSSSSTTPGTSPLGKSPGGTQLKPTEILRLHGIRIEPNNLAHRQQELVLRQNVETKAKKLQLLKKEETRINARVAAASASSGENKGTTLAELAKQLKHSHSAQKKAGVQLQRSKQAYSAEVAKNHAEAQKMKEAGPDGQKLMEVESLELQQQGFKIFHTLAINDNDYLRTHYDVVRAFRWLWRSKGRHLRLIHEESMPPRYHEESKMLASFLINYSKAYPSDVDVLFDLLRVFLQPTSFDFTFVKAYLQETASYEVSDEQKKHIITRFFALLNSEGTEDTKVLSIQILILPMLRALLNPHSETSNIGQPALEDSLESKAASVNTAAADEDKGGISPVSKSARSVVDSQFLRRFVKEGLLHGGAPRRCGNRLCVELLKMSSLFLEYFWNELVDCRKDIIKFAWNHLKNDDVTTKHWAYVTVCRFITVYDTPAKITHQVYVALLRSYQPEAKDLVRLALDILIPALLRRLEIEDFRRAIKYTNKIMYEEGNSVPQLAHIWNVIVRHPEIFFRHRHLFVPQIVNSLNRLGLPINCPHEHKVLSVVLCELLLAWEDLSELLGSSPDVKDVAEGDKRKRTVSDLYIGTQTTSIGDLLESPPDKKSKLDDSSSSPSKDSKLDLEKPGRNFRMDQGMVDAVGNFVLRVILLAGDSKDEKMSGIGKRSVPIFERILMKWPKTEIRSVHFEKVVSMCDVTKLSKPSDPPGAAKSNQEPKVMEKSSKGKKGLKSDKSRGSSAVPGQVKNEGTPVSDSLLRACIDLFLVILKHKSDFLYKASELVTAILRPSFEYACAKDANSMREKVQLFIVNLFTHPIHDKLLLREGAIYSIRIFMENTLMLASSKTAAALAEPSNSASHSSEPSSCAAYFVLQIIEEVTLKEPQFVENFVGSILSLAIKLMKRHSQEASLNTKHMASAKNHVGGSGFQKVLSSPVLGIFEEATGGVLGSSKLTREGNRCEFREPRGGGTALYSLLACTRLIASSRVPYEFSTDRKAYFRLIGDILDSSDDIRLLIATTNQIGRWIIDDGLSGPMTVKEKRLLFAKLTQLEYRGLPEVITQPLTDQVACIMLECYRRADRRHADTVPALVELGDNAMGHENDSDHSNFLSGRALVSCLLTANPVLRSRLVGVFGSLGSAKVAHEDGRITGRTPIDILWQLLNSDYEGLGERSWMLVFVDVLLACSRHDGNAISPSEQKGDVADTAPSQNGGSSHWLPSPHSIGSTNQGGNGQSSESSARKIVLSSYLGNDYLMFTTSLEEVGDQAKSGRGRCISAVRRIAHGDVSLCQNLFQQLLAAAWSTISTDSAKAALVPAIETLLARPYHAQFLKHSHGFGAYRLDAKSLPSNSIQSFLRVLSTLQPAPIISIDLLTHLVAEYNTWHEVLSMLESQHAVVKGILSSHTTKYEEDLRSLIETCYVALGEDDMCRAAKIETCEIPGTKRALSLDVYEKLEHAMNAYSGLIDQTLEAQRDFEQNQLNAWAVDGRKTEPTESDLSLWEDRWVDLNREMCQWQVLSNYAGPSGFAQLDMECQWKTRNWDKVRSLCSTDPSIISSLETGDPQIKMSEVFLAIVDGKLSEVENLHAQTAQLCLYKWQLLPTISTGGRSHNELLQSFHRLVELRESGQIMVETTRHSRNKTFPDLKNLLSAWRHRLPNEGDLLSTWEDVFLWRSHMFDAIVKNFSWSEAGTLATLHDRPWTAIKATQIARKHDMKDTALLYLRNLADSAMDVSDAFCKLREQILSYDGGSELERTGGLNLINTTNLSYFDSRQKSELFRLKAQFLTSLGGKSKANQAYCHAVQVCPSYSRAWVSWGGLCSRLGYEIEQSGKAKAKEESNNDILVSSAKKAGQYLAQAMGCYIEAIQCDTHELARIHLPKCLWMLTKDGHAPGVLCQTLESRGTALPPWVWLPWIPQLLTSLYRVEGNVARAILNKVIAAHPQAVYFSLRAFYLERRDIERARGTSSSSQQPHNSSLAVGYAEELMATLRRAHPTLWASLETILEELIVRFRPSYEEEMLATVSALLQRAKGQLEQQKERVKSDKEGAKTKSDESSAVASFVKTLGRVSIKFFKGQDGPSHPQDDRSRRTATFKRKYKEMFEADFLIEGNAGEVKESQKESFVEKVVAEAKVDDMNEASTVVATESPLQAEPSTLGLEAIFEKLQKWKDLLEAQISITPTMINLQQASPSLSFFASDTPDLWSGACDSVKPVPMRAVRDADASMSSSPSSSAVAAESAAASAAVAVATAAAREGSGGQAGGAAAVVEIPGQYAPNKVNALDSRPMPELNAKLIRFDTSVELVRQHDQIHRRIGFIGSDGKTHKFLLQFAIPYWTRTDERTSQFHYIVGKLLRKDPLSSRRSLTTKPTAVIPVAQRLRMVADDPCNISLDDVYKGFCQEVGRDSGTVADFFRKEVGRLLDEDKTQNEQDANKKLDAEQEIKKMVFKKISREMVESDILLRHVEGVFGSSERTYQFRRVFTKQLAVNGLIQHMFGVVDRTPSKFSWNMLNGQMLSPDFRLNYNNQGFLEGGSLPYRMTRNVQRLVGPLMLQGSFVPSMGSAAIAIRSYKEEVSSILCLLLRDDIVSWYTSKSSARSDVKTQELERQLLDRILKNVALVQSRLKECAPTIVDHQVSGDDPIDKRIRELLERATSAEKLSKMPITYQPWL